MKVTVGGVPEHFNLAWRIAIEQNRFAHHNIEIKWKDIPGGTGSMCKQLRNNELDIAIALTEGVIADITDGNPSKIVQFYVNSPLRWGIYVSANSSIQNVSQMINQKYAISRFKSGSHLMAYVNAKQHGFQLSKADFVVVQNIDGARNALKTNKAQLFMWEKFTTKPYVDSGEFKQIGECGTPWPCFVIAATDKFISEQPEALQHILNEINLSCMLLKNNRDAPALISQRYGIRLADAKQWFSELEYAYLPQIEELQMTEILEKMKGFGIIEKTPELKSICYANNLVLV